jgi:uncharacterized membrane protein
MTAGRRAHLRRLAGVLVVAVAVLLVRRGPLATDRVWGDEDYVVSGAHGLSHDPLPRWFSSADFHHGSYRDALASLARTDAYPPLVYTVAFVAGRLSDPILAPRWLFVLTTAGCAAAIFLALDRRSLPGALLVTVLAFCSSGLAETGADLKWSAVAPALMTVTTLLLLRAVARGDPRSWALYGALMVLCLSTHYFTLSALPAHGLYVALFQRRSLRAFALTAAAVLAVCLPWYLWALPQQTAYVDGFFAQSGQGAAMTRPAWKRPLTAESWLVWLGYNVLTAFGFQPSGVRSLWLVPVAVAVLAALALAVRRSAPPVRELCVLGILQLGVAFLAQSVYALRFGHTTMLTWAYFPTWYPALLLGWGLAGWAGGLAPRLAVVALAAWTVGHAAVLPADEARYKDSLDHRPELAALVAGLPPSTVVVHRTSDEAKLFNLYYRGPLRQTVCGERCDAPFPPDVGELVVLSPGGWPELAPGEGWRLDGRRPIGRARVATFARGDRAPIVFSGPL